MSGRGVVAVFLIGVAVGVVLSFRFARSYARFRLAREQLHTSIDNARGLVGRLREEGLRMARLGLIVVGLAVMLAAIAVGSSH